MISKVNNVCSIIYYNVMSMIVVFDRPIACKNHIWARCVLMEAAKECRRLLLLFEVKMRIVYRYIDLALEVEFHESGFRYFVLINYPTMNIIYLSLPNCSGNFNRFARHQTPWRFTIFGQHCIKRILKYSTHFDSFKISLQTFISLYCSISYRTYCGCTYFQKKIKYCTCESCLTGSVYMRKRI